MTRLVGERVRLRQGTVDDVAELVRIRSTPEVRARWRGDDLQAEVTDDLLSDELHTLIVEDEAGRTIGAIQWHEETEPDYRHAGIDIFLDPPSHAQGYGSDAVRTLVRHLFERGHHRLTIDPAADNDAAIHCYAKVGFQPVGIMRQYERGPDGTWHDGLLMELLADDFDR